jgi:hypothetical protein
MASGFETGKQEDFPFPAFGRSAALFPKLAHILIK